jgi:lipopolysaccharide biosynthesis glycosyltransferase
MRKRVTRPLVICCDDAYVPAALACLTSAYVNNPKLDFDTYWLTGVQSKFPHDPGVTAAIEGVCKTFSRKIQILPVDNSRFDNFKRPTYLPYLGNITYSHLLIPNVLPTDSYLYLDCDIIVQDDLEYLFTFDMGDALFAGVSNGTEPDRTRLGLPSIEEYINTGVLLVNSAQWNKERVFETLLDWYAKNIEKVLLADQDVINGALAGRKKFLSGKWNFQMHNVSADAYEAFDENRFRGIFHFSGVNKPWYLTAKPKYWALYEKYARYVPLQMPTARSMPQKSPFRAAMSGFFEAAYRLLGRRTAGRESSFGAQSFSLEGRTVMRWFMDVDHDEAIVRSAIAQATRLLGETVDYCICTVGISASRIRAILAWASQPVEWQRANRSDNFQIASALVSKEVSVYWRDTDPAPEERFTWLRSRGQWGRPSWSMQPICVQRIAARAKAFAGRPVLELGTSRGFLTAIVASIGCRVTTIDHADRGAGENLEGLGVEVVQADAAAFLRQHSAKYSLIIADLHGNSDEVWQELWPLLLSHSEERGEIVLYNSHLYKNPEFKNETGIRWVLQNLPKCISTEGYPEPWPGMVILRNE